MIDRRKFLGQLIGGVAATAAVRTFPFRVYSFPREIIVPHFSDPIEKTEWILLGTARDVQMHIARTAGIPLPYIHRVPMGPAAQLFFKAKRI